MYTVGSDASGNCSLGMVTYDLNPKKTIMMVNKKTEVLLSTANSVRPNNLYLDFCVLMMIIFEIQVLSADLE